MTHAKIEFHYVNGDEEELETRFEYKEDARKWLISKLVDDPSWLGVDGFQVNLRNVIKVKITGELERRTLRVPK